MSRNAVGDVYSKIIDHVCDQSREDFEGGGVDLSTLDLLKSKWQEKLSALKVTQLPWDPTPSASVPSNSHTLASNARPPPQTLPSNGNTMSTPPSSSSTPGPQIKQETSTLPSAPPQGNQYQIPMPYPPGVQLNSRQRAAMHLQSAYGSQAGPQIAQLQQGNMSRVPMPSQPMNMVKQEDQKPPLSSLSNYPQSMTQPTLPPVKSNQTDGADEARLDWEIEVERRRAFVANNRGEADRMMKEHFLDTQSRLEGGGLMIPLDERQHVKRKARMVGPEAATSPGLRRAQGDATGEEEKASPEEDEDAINSDLDDPEDPAGDDDNEENTEQVMLCTYDKVQRVKNKWKCTLKDGILKVDGTE